MAENVVSLIKQIQTVVLTYLPPSDVYTKHLIMVRGNPLVICTFGRRVRCNNVQALKSAGL